MKNAIIFVIALAISNLAVAESPAHIHGKYAAPFGLEWGLSKEQVTAMGVELTPHPPAENGYRAKTLPKNLSDAHVYALLFKQEFGLVKVGALTRSITNDAFGLKGKERYFQLKKTLVNKYGKPSKEIEKTGLTSNYERSDQFYQCLNHGRCGAWISAWGDDTDGIIILSIHGEAPGKGFISLQYESAAFYTAEAQEDEEQAHSDEDAL